MNRPRIKRTKELVASGGDVYVLRPTEESDLRIEQPDAVARALLHALDGTRTAAELEREYGADRVGEALAVLADAELLDDAADDERVPARTLARHDRQLRYFSEAGTADVPPSEYQRRLREARVVLLGAGGLGSWASYALVCCGIGRLVLVDHDRVEESNFNRQILYRERDIGRVKVEAAAEALRAFDSECEIAAHERRIEGVADARELIEGAGVVVNSADWPAHDIERWVNAACFEAGVPFITLSHSPPVGRVGPMYAPGETGCFECQEAGYRERYPLYDELVEQRRARPSPAATLGPVCAFVGGQVALEVVHRLTGLVRPATLGRSYVYDLRTMTVIHEDVPVVAGCPVCGGAAASR
jgi:bacteriocin biosynthesis cyclodehydratase domain-containing protein